MDFYFKDKVEDKVNEFIRMLQVFEGIVIVDKIVLVDLCCLVKGKICSLDYEGGSWVCCFR